MIPILEKAGLHISFSGVITNEKALRTRQSAARVSPGRLLVETDSPDLPLGGHVQDEPNEPCFLPGVLETLASLRNVDKKELAEQCFFNAAQLFDIAR
jgi:TatD DNase family protein